MMQDEIKSHSGHTIRALPGGKDRRRVVTLDYPFSFDGRDFRAVFIRRLTVEQIGLYFDNLMELRKTDDNKVLPLPLLVDENGEELPEGFLAALDDDDATRLDEAIIDFLPRRLRRDPSNPATTNGSPSPSIGDGSASSSVAQQDGASPN